jgi:hypothetical protein
MLEHRHRHASNRENLPSCSLTALDGKLVGCASDREEKNKQLPASEVVNVSNTELPTTPRVPPLPGKVLSLVHAVPFILPSFVQFPSVQMNAKGVTPVDCENQKSLVKAYLGKAPRAQPDHAKPSPLPADHYLYGRLLVS